MDGAADLGRNPVSKHQIQPEYGDEQADARPKTQARTGTESIELNVKRWFSAWLRERVL